MDNVRNFLNQFSYFVGKQVVLSFLFLISNIGLLFFYFVLPLPLNQGYLLFLIGLFCVPSLSAIFCLMKEKQDDFSYATFKRYLVYYKKGYKTSIQLSILHFLCNSLIYTSLLESLRFKQNHSFFIGLVFLFFMVQLIFCLTYLIHAYFDIEKKPLRIVKNALWLIFNHPWISIRTFCLFLFGLLALNYLYAPLFLFFFTSFFFWLFLKNWESIFKTLKKIV